MPTPPRTGLGEGEGPPSHHFKKWGKSEMMGGGGFPLHPTPPGGGAPPPSPQMIMIMIMIRIMIMMGGEVPPKSWS